MLPDSLIGDDVVLLHLEMAVDLVNRTKSSQASISDVDHAVLTQAAYQTYHSYNVSTERKSGAVVPLTMTSHVVLLRELRDQWINIVQRGSKAPEPLVKLTDSRALWQDTELWDETW